MNSYLVENQESLLNLESTPDIKVSGTFREYYELTKDLNTCPLYF